MLHTKRPFLGLSGTYNVANERSTPRDIECIVEFPDKTQHVFKIDKGSKGQALLGLVFAHLNLTQDDFFSLRIPRSSDSSSNQQQDQWQQSTKTNELSSLNCSSLTNDNQDLTDKIVFARRSPNSLDQFCPESSQQSRQTDFDRIDEQQTVNKCKHKSTSINHGDSLTTNIHQDNNDNLSADISFCLDQQHDQFQDSKNSTSWVTTSWLDPNKGIVKQYKHGPPYKLIFCVRFYVSEVSKLTDQVTRHLLYLQLKNDIAQNRLPVQINSALFLGSLVLQVEVGDFSENLLRNNYLSSFNLLPVQDEEINKKIIDLHKQLTPMTHTEAKSRFLEHASKKLDCYGVEFYDAKDINKILIKLGVSSTGIVGFKHNKKINDYPWGKIIKIMFKRKIFSIQLHSVEDGSDNLIEYNLLTNFACKSFWQECVAQHSFFRLQQPKNTPRKFFSFLNFGSRFQYNGKTEYQTIGATCKRSLSHFSRSPSKRYARRTIPVGWTSWATNGNASKHSDAKSSSSLNYKNGADNSNNLNQNAGLDNNSNHNININNNSNIFGSQEKKSKAYKSMLFIDEYRNQRDSVDCDASTSASHNWVADSDIEDKDDHKIQNKNLVRTESTRIANTLKNAFFASKVKTVSGNQFTRFSESLLERLLSGRSKCAKSARNRYENINDSDNEQNLEFFIRTINLSPGKNGKYGFKVRSFPPAQRSIKSRSNIIVIDDVSPDTPAANASPRLYEGDQIISVNDLSIESSDEMDIKTMIKTIQLQETSNLVLKVRSKIPDSANDESMKSSPSSCSSSSSSSGRNLCPTNLASSIAYIKMGLETRSIVSDFEHLSRKSEDEMFEESKLAENIDKNRYRDILPYDSTRVSLLDSMTGDYINASYVDMKVPSGQINRYIATQGPLPTTCEDFWQMVWEQNCSLIIMVTPLVEAGRTKCHKYWPDEKEHCRHGQIIVRNLKEKSRSATIERSLQIGDIKVSSIIESSIYSTLRC